MKRITVEEQRRIAQGRRAASAHAAAHAAPITCHAIARHAPKVLSGLKRHVAALAILTAATATLVYLGPAVSFELPLSLAEWLMPYAP